MTVCEVCWTSSWAPCEAGTPNAVPDKDTGGWMVCQHCQVTEFHREARALADSLAAALEETTQWFHHQHHLFVETSAKRFMDCFVLPCANNKGLVSAYRASKQEAGEGQDEP